MAIYAFAVIGTVRWVVRWLKSYVITPAPRGVIIRDVVDFGPLPGYPFQPKFVEVTRGCRIHYVDEGPADAKETVLCLHGEPTWSCKGRQTTLLKKTSLSFFPFFF